MALVAAVLSDRIALRTRNRRTTSWPRWSWSATRTPPQQGPERREPSDGWQDTTRCPALLDQSLFGQDQEHGRFAW